MKSCNFANVILWDFRPTLALNLCLEDINSYFPAIIVIFKKVLYTTTSLVRVLFMQLYSVKILQATAMVP